MDLVFNFFKQQLKKSKALIGERKLIFIKFY